MTNYSKQDVLDFMRKTSLMSVAVVYEGRPISSILLFAVDDDFTMYFATHRGTYKSQALLTNPQISFCVWQQNQMLVQADGQTNEVTDQSAISQVLDKLVASMDRVDRFWPPILRIRDDSGYIVFRIKPTWLRVLDLQSDTITSKELPFTEIEVST